MNEFILLAIVEVEQADRVICRAPNCGHSVYKRIHVVKLNGNVTVYGADCFKRLLGAQAGAKPHYGTSTSRQLTHEERRLLLENTESLIAQFEAEVQAAAKVKQSSINAIAQPSTTATAPTPPLQQVNMVDEWARRQAAREAWQRDKPLAKKPIPTPQLSPKEWENWGKKEWEEWAKRRYAGKAAWIDTPEATAAWKALTLSKLR